MNQTISMGSVGLFAMLSLSVGSGCAGMRVRQVAAWEQEGNESALKAALSDDSADVQEAAIAAWVRYGEYDTGRPSVLASLGSSSAEAARQAEKRLFGQPPRAVPDPHPVSGASGSTILYFYRPSDDGGDARRLTIDGSDQVLLQPGRYHRYATGTGSHQACIALPDVDAPVTDDPSDGGGQLRKVAPQCSTLMTRTAGIYFVRQRTQGSKGRPELKVMPVPPGLSAVQALRPAEPSDR